MHREVVTAVLAALVACAAPAPVSVSNAGTTTALVLPPGRECTTAGWCLFPDPPLDADVVIETERAVYVGGARGGRAALARWDATGWQTTLFDGESITGFGSRGAELWFAGDGLAPHHLVGDRWLPEGPSTDSIARVVLGGDDVFVASFRTLIHRGPRHDWQLAPAPPIFAEISSIASDKNGGVYVVLQPGKYLTQVFAWRAGAFEPLGEALEGPRAVNHVSAGAPDDIATLGPGPSLDQLTLRRWNGRTWSETVIDETMSVQALRHRGRDLVALGARLQAGTHVVDTIAGDHVTTAVFPDKPSYLEIGPDGSMWACCDRGLWFHR